MKSSTWICIKKKCFINSSYHDQELNASNLSFHRYTSTCLRTWTKSQRFEWTCWSGKTLVLHINRFGCFWDRFRISPISLWMMHKFVLLLWKCRRNESLCHIHLKFNIEQAVVRISQVFTYALVCFEWTQVEMLGKIWWSVNSLFFPLAYCYSLPFLRPLSLYFLLSFRQLFSAFACYSLTIFLIC